MSLRPECGQGLLLFCGLQIDITASEFLELLTGGIFRQLRSIAFLADMHQNDIAGIAGKGFAKQFLTLLIAEMPLGAQNALFHVGAGSQHIQVVIADG